MPVIYDGAFFKLRARSSYRRCSVKKGVLRNFAKFTGKHLCQRLLFNKVARRPATLLKKSLWHRCFPVNFAKFLRTPFLQNPSGRLLLKSQKPLTTFAKKLNHICLKGLNMSKYA